MAISNILLFFWLVLPLLFSLFLLLPVLITVIIKIIRRRNNRQDIAFSSNTSEMAADKPIEERIDEQITEPDGTEEKTFAEILREHRTSRHLSQEYVAEQLDVTRQAVSKWENGTSEPSTANLIALAKLYGISLDELVRGTKS